MNFKLVTGQAVALQSSNYHHTPHEFDTRSAVKAYQFQISYETKQTSPLSQKRKKEKENRTPSWKSAVRGPGWVSLSFHTIMKVFLFFLNSFI